MSCVVEYRRVYLQGLAEVREDCGVSLNRTHKRGKLSEQYDADVAGVTNSGSGGGKGSSQISSCQTLL